MKLLIATQAADLDDPILGFAHQWIEGLAKRCEHVEVICLKEGRHALPSNVVVHSLGKERGAPVFARRIVYSVRFLSLAWKLRRKYDVVFVHMNEEYVLLGGVFWRLFGKRVVLWRNFKTGSWMTPFTARLASAVCYTSPSSFVARYRNSTRMPIGIDTELFKAASPAPSDSILFLGRLDAVKKPDVFLEALALLERGGVSFKADMYGDPTPGEGVYAEELKKRFSTLKNISFHSSVRNDETPWLYQTHSIYVNLTPSGSFDKTIGEAAASGCVVVGANEVLHGVVPTECIVDPDSPEAVARGIKAALALPEAEHRATTTHLRSWVEQEHSLSLLMERLLAVLGGTHTL